MNRTDSFIVYNDNCAFDELCDEQLGKVFRAMISHSRGKELGLNKAEPSYWVFESLRSGMEANARKWDKMREKRQEAGRKGGLAKASNAKQTHTSLTNQANLAVPVPVPAPVSVPVPAPVSVPVSVSVPAPISVPEGESGANTSRTPAKKSFIPPTVDEIAAYAEEISYSIDPQRFIDHYISNGWKVGRNTMKDWKAAVRTWQSRDNEERENKNERCKTSKYNDLF